MGSVREGLARFLGLPEGYEVLDGGLPVGGAQQARPGAGHGLELFGADPRGTRAEPAVGGQQVLGDGDVCGQRALPRG